MVQPDNKVAVRPVTVSQQDETQAVIARGLQADERVVTTGFARLKAGSRGDRDQRRVGAAAVRAAASNRSASAAAAAGTERRAAI